MASEKTGKQTPQPDDAIGLITTVTIVVLAGGLVLPILGGTIGRTAGARTSVRMDHQQRQAEVQRAIERDAAERSISHPDPQQ